MTKTGQKSCFFLVLDQSETELEIKTVSKANLLFFLVKTFETQVFNF